MSTLNQTYNENNSFLKLRHFLLYIFHKTHVKLKIGPNYTSAAILNFVVRVNPTEEVPSFAEERKIIPPEVNTHPYQHLGKWFRGQIFPTSKIYVKLLSSLDAVENTGKIVKKINAIKCH